MEIKDTSILGSTDYADIMGKHSWKSRHDVWRRIVVGAEQPVGDLLRRGLFMEPSHKGMLEYNLKQGGYDVRLKRAKTLFYEVDGVPFRLTGDYFAVPTMRHRKPLFGCELKQAHGQQRSSWGEVMSDDVPDMYKIQCVMQCYKYGWDFVILDADFSTFTLPTPFLIRADNEYARHIEAEAVKFWKEHIEPGVMPEVDESDACRKTLLEWLEKRRPLNEEEVAVAEEIARITRRMDADKKLLKAEQNKLIESAIKTVHEGQTNYEELTYQVITEDVVKDKKFCQFKADKNGKMSAKFYPKGFSV